MSVAIAIEAGAGGSPGRISDQTLPAAPEMESFRSNWQSQLNSIKTGVDGADKTNGGTSLGLSLDGHPPVISSKQSAKPTVAEWAEKREAGSGAGKEPINSSIDSQMVEGRKKVRMEVPSADGSTAPPVPFSGMSIPAAVVAGSPLLQGLLANRANQETNGGDTVLRLQNVDSCCSFSGESFAIASGAEHAGVDGGSRMDGEFLSTRGEPGSNHHAGLNGQDSRVDVSHPTSAVTEGNGSSSLASESEGVSSRGESPDQAKFSNATRASGSLHGASPMLAQLPGHGFKATSAPVSNVELNPFVPAAANENAPSSRPFTPMPGAGRRSIGDTGKVAGSSGLAGTKTENSIHLVQHGNPLNSGQPDNGALETSSLSRNPGGGSGAGNLSAEITAGSREAATGTGSRETFAALDGSPETGTPAWIHAGTQRAEAGFQDPALGWVGVRADGGAGGVHAAVVPGSADAAQELGGHLAGLNAYLTDRQLHVDTLTVASPEGGSAQAGLGHAGSDHGGGQGMHQDAGRGSGQGSGQASDQASDQASHRGLQPVSVAPVAASSERAVEPSMPPGVGGRHISVMA
jgi:hypothetical protein